MSNYKNLLEKERIKLIQHVNNNYSCQYKRKTKKRDGYYLVSCWLGKNPTGQLFTVEQETAFGLDESLAQLANDMWDFLFTPKGEQIIRKEHEIKE